MAQKAIAAVGIERDNFSIRAAKVSIFGAGRNSQYRLEGLQEVKGDFNKDEDLVNGLREIKEKVGVAAKDRVVTCISGKQVFVAQMPFRRLPQAEMANALRIEIRKTLPFESAGAAIDFQVLDEDRNKKDENVDLIVTAVAHSLLEKQLRSLEKAGMKAEVVDVLPLAVANAFWTLQTDPTDVGAHVVVHMQADVCTVVIDGNMAPFYTRSIYFAAEELYGQNQADKEIAEREKLRRLASLGDELRRSLAFYEKTYSTSSFGNLHLLGNYLETPELFDLVSEKIGLKVEPSALLERLGVTSDDIPAGKYDVAVCLAMRAE